jgi:thioredoxin-related protein
MDMSSNSSLSTLVCLLLVGGAAAAALWLLPTPGSHETPYLGSSIPIQAGSLLLFTQDGCPPCRTLESVLSSDQVQSFLKQTGVRITEIDTRQNQELVRKYHVQFTPTLVFLDSKSHPGATKKGAMDSEEFMAWVRANR